MILFLYLVFTNEKHFSNLFLVNNTKQKTNQTMTKTESVLYSNYSLFQKVFYLISTGYFQSYFTGDRAFLVATSFDLACCLSFSRPPLITL